MAKPYNGFPSWNAWNVSLWINNDEALYNWARYMVQRFGKGKAAEYMAIEQEGKVTPDGAIYNKTSIRLAIRGM